MFQREPGGDLVYTHLDDALIGAVNLAEVATFMIKAGNSEAETEASLAALPIEVVPATTQHALAAAALLPQTSKFGLSLADRFCLALARERGLPAMTADRAWAKVKVPGIEVELIR